MTDFAYVKLDRHKAVYARLRWHILREPDDGHHLRARCGRKASRRHVLIVDQPTDNNPTCLGCLRMSWNRP